MAKVIRMDNPQIIESMELILDLIKSGKVGSFVFAARAERKFDDVEVGDILTSWAGEIDDRTLLSNYVETDIMMDKIKETLGLE